MTPHLADAGATFRSWLCLETYAARLRQDSFDAPSQVVSTVQHGVTEPCFAGPSLQRLGRSVPRQVNRSSGVMHVFGSSRPSAVARLVAKVIVDTVKLEAFRTFAHVAEKCRKVVAPLFAHGDAAASVVGVFTVAGTEAASLRAIPAVVRPTGAVFPGRVPVFGHSGLGISGLVASTADGSPGRQTVGQDESFGAAIAGASPHKLIVSALRGVHEQFTEPLSAKFRRYSKSHPPIITPRCMYSLGNHHGSA